MNDRPEGIVGEGKAGLSAVDETRGVSSHRIFIFPLLCEMNEIFSARKICSAIGVEGLLEQCGDVARIAFEHLPVDFAGGVRVSAFLKKYALQIELFQWCFGCDGDRAFERLPDGG